MALSHYHITQTHTLTHPYIKCCTHMHTYVTGKVCVHCAPRAIEPVPLPPVSLLCRLSEHTPHTQTRTVLHIHFCDGSAYTTYHICVYSIFLFPRHIQRGRASTHRQHKRRGATTTTRGRRRQAMMTTRRRRSCAIRCSRDWLPKGTSRAYRYLISFQSLFICLYFE